MQAMEKLDAMSHQIPFDKIHWALSWILVVTSIWFIVSGASMIIATTGFVRGSEFSMQITIVNLLAKMLFWVGLHFLCNLTYQQIEKKKAN